MTAKNTRKSNARKVIVCAALFALLAPGLGIADALLEIRKSGTIKVGYREDVPPFSTIGENGKPEGYSIDICNFIVKKVGEHLNLPTLETEFVRVTAASRLDAVVKGDIHIECGNTTSTHSRQEIVDFSNLFYVTGASLMMAPGLNITDVAQLGARSIAVVNNTTTQQVLAGALRESNVPARLEAVSDHRLALRMLKQGQVDGVAADRATLLGFSLREEGMGGFQLATFMLSLEPYAFPIPRDDADFRLVINRALSELYLTGKVRELWQKWFGQFEARPGRLLLDVYRLNSLAE